MTQISKQALLVENNQSFPNNNNGAITPSELRGFNIDLIDSTVNQTVYTTDSASWNAQIDALEAFTSSQQPSFTALNSFTASQLVINSGVNTYTQSANGRLTALENETANLEVFTSSINQILSNGTLLGLSTRFNLVGPGTFFSASIVQNVGGPIATLTFTSDNAKLNTSSFNDYTASTAATQSLFSASVATSISQSSATFTAFSSSQNSFNLSATASIVELLNLSSSLSGGYATQGELDQSASVLQANIDTKLNTASFNSYTSSNDSKVNSLIAGTGSYATTGSNTFRGNQIINGLTTINVGAAGTESQKDFVVVTGSVINGKTYNQVTFGLQDYPSLGDNFKDAFVFDYWDSTGYNYGAAYQHNAIRTGAELLASGSGNSFGGKGYAISQLRQLGSGSFLNQYASIINIGSYAPSTTDYIQIGHNALPYLQLSSLSNQITGSTIISGSNGLRLIGNQTITGSLILSSSAATELQVIGDTQFTGSLIMSSSNAVELTVIGNSVFTGSAFGNVISASITSNTASINLNIGNYFTLSIPTGTTRISPSNIQAGTSATLVITTASGSLVTFDSSVKQPSGSAYIPTSGSVDILSFVSVNSSSLFVVATKNMI